jgi:hypothetical protein
MRPPKAPKPYNHDNGSQDINRKKNETIQTTFLLLSVRSINSPPLCHSPHKLT